MITASLPAWVLWQHLPPLIFLFCFGACVGSFLNVVISRLPMGMSVITPPSRCPFCGVRLRFFRENLPILGWFFIRGRCRGCGVRVPAGYMLIELAAALGFVLLYLIFFTTFFTSLGAPAWFDEIGGAWWRVHGFALAWPAFMAIAILFAGLVAMLVIDARTCTIPIQIPHFVIGAAAILWPLQALLPLRTVFAQTWPVPGVGWTATGLAAGGLIGLAIAMTLLFLGWIRPSFADYDEYVRDDQPLAEYPHARREMWRELLFLLPIILGLAGGAVVGAQIGGAPPLFVQALAMPWTGYFIGGGIVWTLRIFATLGFGREAMGLGDVHLMGAVGAVLGPIDPVLVFFIAPFSGMIWFGFERARGVLRQMGGRTGGRRGGEDEGAGVEDDDRGMARAMPYGPHLALAAIVLVLARPMVDRGLGLLDLPPTPRGFVMQPVDSAAGPMIRSRR